MIVRNAPVRYCRRTLASPLSRALLRQFSTATTTPTASTTKPQAPWLAEEAPAGPPKIYSASRKKQRIVQDSVLSLRTDSAHEHKGRAWTTEHPTADFEKATPAQQFDSFQRVQKNTRSLGSKVHRRYSPKNLLDNPPKPEEVTLQMLMAAQTHLGHRTAVWNPANARYIYGVREGIHVISLEVTAAHLRRAARVVEEVAYSGGLILFVGNKKGQMEIITRAAERAGACHLHRKWTPGAITNRDVILAMHGTKVVDHNDEELPGFEKFRGAARPLLPDLVVCMNPLENYTLLYECGLKSIPTIGVIDTNVDPSWVTYTIPANDDSHRSISVIAGALGWAGEAGQKRRLAEAQKGNATWSNSEEVVRHMRRETRLIMEERKAVMGRIQEKVQGFSEEEQKLLRQRDVIEGVEVTESEMMGMMGETAVETSKSSSPGLAGIEEQLLKAKEVALSLETEVKATSEGSGEVEAEVSASPASDPLLEGIETQLLNAKTAALSLETEVKATSAPEVSVEADTESATSSKLESIEELLLEANGAASSLEAEVKASSQPSGPAETEAAPEASSKLESIEDQLAGLQKEAQVIEAQLSPGSDKSE